MPRTPPSALPPLSQGNRLQRAYARWAEPYYRRAEPALAERMELMDRWLYSRRGLGFWLGTLGALVGCVAGLRATGLPWWVALLSGALLCVALPLTALSVWLVPGQFTHRRAVRAAWLFVPLAMLGGLVGFVVGHVERHGWDAWPLLQQRLSDKLIVLAPSLLLVAGTMMGLIWIGARLREQVLQRQLEQARLEQERDAAQREAVQAQLKLLQGQIQPHFIFNTLSAVQHWVDQGDPRAGPLLRSLTAFLRGSTEQMTREQVHLADEVARVGDYLTVMASRLGDRLTWTVDVDEAVREQPLPPGLLLTLVENAVEHGISPSLSGGRIALRAWAEGPWCRIRVTDSAGRWPDPAQEGVGLRNSRDRLRHRFGEAARLHIGVVDGETEAALDLPRPSSSAADPGRAA